MLLWTYLLCLLFTTLVASQSTIPEVLEGYDPGKWLEQSKDGLSQSSPETSHFIRGLLRARQCCGTGGKYDPQGLPTFSIRL